MDIPLTSRYDLRVTTLVKDEKTGKEKEVETKYKDLADFQFANNGQFLWLVTVEAITKEKPGGFRKEGLWIPTANIVKIECLYRRDFQSKNDRQKFDVLDKK